MLFQLQVSHRCSHDRHRFQGQKNLNPFSFRNLSNRSDMALLFQFLFLVLTGKFVFRTDQLWKVNLLTMSSSSKMSWTFGQTVRNLWINRNWFIGLCKWCSLSARFRCCKIISSICLSKIYNHFVPYNSYKSQNFLINHLNQALIFDF